MGWLDDLTSSGAFQLGYPLATAILSSHPQGANIAQGLNTGLAVANRFSQQSKQDAQNAEAQKRLEDLFSSSKFVTPQIDTTKPLTMPGGTTDSSIMPVSTSAQTEPSMAPFGSFTKAPTNTQPVFSPQIQKLGSALSASGDTQGALRLATSLLNKEQTAPHIFGSPESGYHALDQSGNVTQLVAGQPKAPTKRVTPFQFKTGDKLVTGYYDETGQAHYNDPLPMELPPGGQEKLDQATQRLADVERARGVTESNAATRIAIEQDAAQRARDTAARAEEARRISENQPGQQVSVTEAKSQLAALKRQGAPATDLEKAANDMGWTITGTAPESTFNRALSTVTGGAYQGNDVQVRPLTRRQRATGTGAGASGSYTGEPAQRTPGAGTTAAPPAQTQTRGQQQQRDAEQRIRDKFKIK